MPIAGCSPRYRWDLIGLGSGRPTVGDLMTLCEENFTLLCRLAPHLKDQRGVAVSRRKGSVDLFLQVEEHSRYTSLIRLTYLFSDSDCGGGRGPGSGIDCGAQLTGPRADPDARLRIYHDARQVEVLDLRQTVLPLYADYQRPALEAKWRVNLFLGKWLTFCLRQGHRFGPEGVAVPLPQGGDLIDTLT